VECTSLPLIIAPMPSTAQGNAQGDGGTGGEDPEKNNVMVRSADERRDTYEKHPTTGPPLVIRPTPPAHKQLRAMHKAMAVPAGERGNAKAHGRARMDQHNRTMENHAREDQQKHTNLTPAK
jgi:hypothetical protein